MICLSDQNHLNYTYDVGHQFRLERLISACQIRHNMFYEYLPAQYMHHLLELEKFN